MRLLKHLPYALICFVLLFSMHLSKAHADFTYSDYTITYTVTSGTTIVADAGGNKNLVQPNAGMSGITGTASSTAGSITSTSWSYVSCTPSCSKPGMVVSGANGTSSPLSATMANMDGAAVDTHFTYKFSATDSAGNTGVDYMDIIITAPTTYTITASSGSNGSVTPAGTTTVNGGSSQNYAITPSSGYQVASVTVDGTSVGAVSTYAFSNVSANHTISATFSAVPPPPPTTYTITASSGSNGSVTPSGTTTVTSGGSQLYTITPASGYDIASVTVDGSSVGAPGTYNFSNVTANHTISATFTATTPPPPPPPTAACSDGQDNDGDGKADFGGATINGVPYPPDPGCSSASDNNEVDPKPIFIEF